MTGKTLDNSKLNGIFLFALILFVIQTTFMTNYLVFGFGTRGSLVLSGILEGELLTLEGGQMANMSAATLVSGPMWDPTSCSRRSVLLFLPAIAIGTAVILFQNSREYYSHLIVGATGIVGLLTIISLFGAPAAMGRFLLYLEGVGVCAIAIALHRKSLTKRRLFIVLVLEGVIAGMQFASADAAPDYGSCTQRYLTASEMTAKDWGASSIPGTVTTNYYFSDEKLHPVGNHQQGLNELLANRSTGAAVEQNRYIGHRSSADVYVIQEKSRVRFTYDVESELDPISNKIYANRDVSYYWNGSVAE
jgi:hypothetical protein